MIYWPWKIRRSHIKEHAPNSLPLMPSSPCESTRSVFYKITGDQGTAFDCRVTSQGIYRSHLRTGPIVWSGPKPNGDTWRFPPSLVDCRVLELAGVWFVTISNHSQPHNQLISCQWQRHVLWSSFSWTEFETGDLTITWRQISSSLLVSRGRISLSPNGLRIGLYLRPRVARKTSCTVNYHSLQFHVSLVGMDHLV